MCKSQQPRQMKGQQKAVHEMTDEPDGHTEFFVEVVHVGDDDGDWMIDLKVNDRKLRFKLDTGAQCNVIPQVVQEELRAPITRSRARLVMYSGHKITPKRKTNLLYEHKDVYYNLKTCSCYLSRMLRLKPCRSL